MQNFILGRNIPHHTWAREGVPTSSWWLFWIWDDEHINTGHTPYYVLCHYVQLAELSLAVSHGSGLDVMCNIIDGSKIVPNWGQSSPHESQMTLLFAAVHCSPSCLPPMVVTKGISIAVMWCEVQLVHYTLIFVTCYHCYVAAAVLYTVIISGLYFAIIESCHNRCFISDVSSQYVTMMGTVTECDTSRTISYLALSIVRMSIVLFIQTCFIPEPFILHS